MCIRDSHSIAAFNNAGFDNLGGMHNLIPYKDNILLNITTDVLVIVGGIGFLVLVDIVKQKSFKKLCLHSKVAISMTAVLLIGGTLILKATENITWMGAFFQSMTTVSYTHLDVYKRQTIPYICGLRAKVGCKRLSEHSTCSD